MKPTCMMTILLAAALLGAAQAPTHAQDDAATGPGARLRMHGMAGRERLARALGLTDEQRAKMREAHERQMRRSIAERADLKIAKLDLRKLVRADHPDQHAIEAQVDKIAGMRAELQKQRLATMIEIRAMLTADQRARLREMRDVRSGGMRERMRGDHSRGMREGMREALRGQRTESSGDRGPTRALPDGGGPSVDQF